MTLLSSKPRQLVLRALVHSPLALAVRALAYRGEQFGIRGVQVACEELLSMGMLRKIVDEVGAKYCLTNVPEVQGLKEILDADRRYVLAKRGVQLSKRAARSLDFCDEFREMVVTAKKGLARDAKKKI